MTGYTHRKSTNLTMRKLTFILPLIILLSSCVSWVPHYRQTIQQGVVLSQAKINQLKPGMTKAQVTDLLGDSMLQPVFKNDTVHYIYTNKPNRRPIVERQLTLKFSNGKLVNASGDYQIPAALTR